MMAPVPRSDPDGLLYSAIDPDGHLRVGWLCREDQPCYDDLTAWHDALKELEDPAGLRLLSIKRCHESDALAVFARAANV